MHVDQAQPDVQVVRYAPCVFQRGSGELGCSVWYDDLEMGGSWEIGCCYAAAIVDRFLFHIRH